MPGGFAASLGGWSAPPRPQRAGSKWWLISAAVPAIAVAAVWIAIRTLPWFGPALADTLRATVGSRTVTELEELSASVEDEVRLRLGSGAVHGLSEYTPPELSLVSRVAPLSGTPGAFRPRDTGAMFAVVASPDDGRWQAVPSGDTPVIYRTILHPDPRRPYAELFVFAIDLSRARIHAVAGSVEPKAAAGSTELPRPGLIQPEHNGQLLAAFNGGFKAEHGHYGMMVNGTELLPPRSGSCTVAARSDGSLRVGTWRALRAASDDLSWWRQTPACMAEGGALHAGLQSSDSKNWGATIEGSTVIRRSAVGLDAQGKTLFVGISNATTARALASGMLHAGAHDVAQLDVNFSYPKFALYRRSAGGELDAITAVKGFAVDRDEYLRKPSTRDFFYVTSKPRAIESR